MDGVTDDELPSSADPEVLTSMLIGSFNARYIGASDLPDDWPQRALQAVWPDQSSRSGFRPTPQPPR
jgi:hypothetical protein